MAIIIFLLLTLATSTTHALEKCSMGTDPTRLTHETSKAKFIVNVANLGGTGAFSGWKIEFQCGLRNKQNATVDGADKIYTEVDNIAPISCEFHAGGHTLKVKGVRSDGAEVDQCEASYFVQEAKKLCNLSLNPERGITSNTTLAVSGFDLPSGGQLALFVDGQRITGNAADPGFVPTPTFSGRQIPAKYMTLGSHKVELKPYSFGDVIRALPVIGMLPIIGVGGGSRFGHQYGNAACSLGFRVGTDANPGSAFGPAPAGIVNWIPGIPAGTPSCDPDPNNPGIETAIGCIHTSPVGFIKDFLKFILGIAGGLSFLLMLLGVFQMLSSAGNPDTLRAGQERLTSAVIGLLLVIFAVMLLQIIGVNILGIEGFK